MIRGSVRRAWLGAVFLGANAALAQIVASEATEIALAKSLWARSPHGRMLERILPPAVEPPELPEPNSEGARLTARYCVQCHHLPSPAMHTAAKWQSIVERMVWRMQGNGNLAELMKEMMAHVRAPTAQEVATLTHYLQKHAQKEMSSGHPALKTTAGQMYSLACSQCHALPDPQRHTAREWPVIVERMKSHMAWANVIVGASELHTIPELNATEIVRLLQRYARPPSSPR